MPIERLASCYIIQYNVPVYKDFLPILDTFCDELTVLRPKSALFAIYTCSFCVFSSKTSTPEAIIALTKVPLALRFAAKNFCQTKSGDKDLLITA